MSSSARACSAPHHTRNGRLQATSWRAPLLAGLATVAVFAALALPRLTAVGFQYDELFQAPAAFAWRGERVPLFAQVFVHGIPLLNMAYVGALKSAIYGAYLVTGAPFTPWSWRFCGIAIYLTGLLGFYLLAGRRVPRPALWVLGALVLTDVSLLVLVRNDWGPVALSLALRFLFVAVWIRTMAGGPSLPAFALLGALFGLSVFEKLSASVLIVPIAFAVVGARHGRWRCAAAAAAGAALGAVPLFAANGLSLLRQRSLVSLASLSAYVSAPRTLHAAMDHLARYASVGLGEDAAPLVLGANVSASALRTCELAALIAIGVVLIVGWRLGSSRWWRFGVLSYGSWLGIGAALYLLPANTWIHHWLTGTPFQYVAAMSGVAALVEERERTTRWSRRMAPLLVGALGLFAAARFTPLLEVERAIWRGQSGDAFRPSFTQLGEFAARQGPSVTFIASDWGVATQIYCLAQGRPGVVHEPFWNYGGRVELARVVEPYDTFFLVEMRRPLNVNPEAREAIRRDAASLPGWREAPLDAELTALPEVSVQKFARAPGEGVAR